MNAMTMAWINVGALRRRLIGLLVLVAIAVGVCVAAMSVAERARAVPREQVQEGLVNRAVLLERLSGRDDTRSLTSAHLAMVTELAAVQSVEPVAQVSFGYKSAEVSGVLLYATSPRPSMTPPIVGSVRPEVFPLARGEVVLPRSSGGESLAGALGEDIEVQFTRHVGRGQGAGVSAQLRVVALFDPSWQIDGPDAAYLDDATVVRWAAARAGINQAQYRDQVGYDSATIVAGASGQVPELLRYLQSQGFAASSFQQQWEALPGVLELVRLVGLVLLVVLVVLTGFGAYQVTASLGRQRRREVGILKAVGFADRDVFGMLSFEAALISVSGTMLGLLLAVPLATAGNLALRSRDGLDEFLAGGLVTPGGPTILAAFVLVLSVVGIGSVVPSVRAARLGPADAMRQW